MIIVWLKYAELKNNRKCVIADEITDIVMGEKKHIKKVQLCFKKGKEKKI